MKKTYQYPRTEVITIAAHRLMAGSVDGFNATLNSTGGSGDKALGRRSSDWDDEGEDY